jgi:hypothetical protein
MTHPYERWIDKELVVDGIRWRVVEIAEPDAADGMQQVRFERVDERARFTPPIPRDPVLPPGSPAGHDITILD